MRQHGKTGILIAGARLVACLFVATLANPVQGSTGESSREYLVRRGDTLFGIAREVLGDVALWREVARINRLAPPYSLEVGSRLMLPVASGSKASARPEPASPAPPPDPPSPVPAPVAAAIDDGFSDRPGFVPRHSEPLDRLIALLNERNPSIRAAEAEARAATYRPSQASSLPDPMLRAAIRSDPQREVMVENGMTTVREKRMTMPMFQVSQMIPLGKLKPMAEFEAAMAAAAKESAGKERVTLVTALKSAYAELHYLDRSALALGRIREVMEMIISNTEVMYRAGEARQSDLLRAHLEVSMLRDRLIAAEARRRGVVAEINSLLDREDSTEIGVPESLVTYDLPEVEIAAASERSPEVVVAVAEAEAAGANVDVARSRFIPDLEVMGGTMINPDLDPRFELGIGISLPVWSRTKQEPGLQEAKARREAAVERVRAARAGARGRISAAVASARSAHRQADLYGNTIIPQAVFALDASLAGYRSGQVDFMTVLENAATLMEYEVERARMTAEFYRAIAMLEQETAEGREWKKEEFGKAGDSE